MVLAADSRQFGNPVHLGFWPSVKKSDLEMDRIVSKKPIIR